MNKLKNFIFVSDLDGTLLPHNKKLNPKDLDAIEKFRELGGIFTIATGRILQSAEMYLESLKIDGPAVLCNGSAIYDNSTKKFVWQEFLNEEIYQFAKEIFAKYPNIGGEINTNPEIYVPSLSAAEL